MCVCVCVCVILWIYREVGLHFRFDQTSDLQRAAAAERRQIGRVAWDLGPLSQLQTVVMWLIKSWGNVGCG